MGGREGVFRFLHQAIRLDKEGIVMFLNLVAPLAAIFSLAFIPVLFWLIDREDPGTERMKEVAGYIREGANVFLRREFQTIAYFIVGLAILFLIFRGWQIAVGFVLGALLSMLAMVVGMNAATRANVRTSNAARQGRADKALTIAFRGGAVMGLLIVALNLMGISFLMLIFGIGPHDPESVSLLVGFGVGASLAALFAQLGGGIYTKAADIGADLVGKIEAHFREDDPRNPAVIADQVGDNVGDCAGRGADLFESGSDNLVTMMIIGASPIFFGRYGWAAILFPLLSRAVGSVGTVIGAFLVRGKEGRSPTLSVCMGFVGTAVFCLVSFYAITRWLMHDMTLFYSNALGLAAAFIVFLIVNYYTGIDRGPARRIVELTRSGSALTILSGLFYGMESCAWEAILIAVIMLAAYYIGGGGLSGIYNIAAAVLGITEMKGIIMASDTFGPIADNSAGISEMAGLSEDARRVGDELDAVGNMTKALTKGYAMTTATLTGTVILFSYLFEAARLLDIPLTGIESLMINLADPLSIAAILIGSAMPFLFSALAIQGVGRVAFQMVEEIRRQFGESPGVLAGDCMPDYSRCIDISTRGALREMIAPTVLSVVMPIVVGFSMGVWALAAYLIAVKVVGALLATFMFNAGGAWDNAKKYVESGRLDRAQPADYAAVVMGDTVGDPLKDTAGPSLHILIKLQNILAITMLPLFVTYTLLK
jgi:K(+)-stimulated pyrophosphate-energized sodium pump